MRKELFETRAIEEMNLIPLLDLAWTLLVVFVISITAAVQGIKVDLPKASDTPSIAKPKTRAISIQATGQIYLDTYPVTLQELEEYLRKYKAADPNLPIVVKGDEKINYGRIIEVLDLLNRLEINQLGLVTQKLVK